MYKVLIADDEPRFREFLRQVIDWNKHGFSICGEARDGEEAWMLARKEKPHIALLDINMPLIDGITVSEKLRESGIDTRVILITGHSEFEYARRALKLGVEDYILKPYNKDELLSALIGVRVKLDKSREDARRSVNDNDFMKERFLNMLISEDYMSSESETMQTFSRLGIAMRSNAYLVASIEIDDMYRKWTEQGDISLVKFAVGNVLSELYDADGVHLVFNGPESRVVSLINFSNDQAAQDFDNTLYVSLCEAAKKYLKFSVTIGVGRPVFQLGEIRKSYVESAAALQYRLEEQTGTVLSYAEIADRSNTAGFHRIDLHEKLQVSLRLNDRAEIMASLQSAYDGMKQSRMPVELAYINLVGLLSVCLSFITEMGENVGSVMGKDFSPYSEIRTKRTLEEAFEWLRHVYLTTLLHLADHKATRSQTVADSIKAYVKQHYMNSDLRVELIARAIFLESSYMRKLFAKETKTTLTDYITAVRMQKAKELIHTSSIKHSEIAAMVGYSDPGYFSKCFKKHYGVSPSEYVNAEANKET